MIADILPFVMNHWGLCLIFLFAFGWVITLEMQAKLVKGVGVTVQALTRLINDDDALVVDIRSQAAYASGHILSAKHIEASQVSGEHKHLKNLKGSPFILVCDYGIKAAKLAKQLQKDGFTQAVSLTGGMEAWNKAELPTVSQ